MKTGTFTVGNSERRARLTIRQGSDGRYSAQWRGKTIPLVASKGPDRTTFTGHVESRDELLFVNIDPNRRLSLTEDYRRGDDYRLHEKLTETK